MRILTGTGAPALARNHRPLTPRASSPPLPPASDGAGCLKRDLHLPHAPADSAPRPGSLSEMWYGTRTAAAPLRKAQRVRSSLDMARRFWVGAVLHLTRIVPRDGVTPSRPESAPLCLTESLDVDAVCDQYPPVVLWAGWPLILRGADSIRQRSLNMFSLIALGIGAAYLYSLAATFAPELFPANLRAQSDGIPVYTRPLR